MLSVYGLTANGRTDPTATRPPVTLSWRLGGDGACDDGCDQESYRVRVTSLDAGDVVFDTGLVHSPSNRVRYDCQAKVGTYVWFVEVTDTGGDTSCSAPAAFCLADEEADVGERRCTAVVATDRDVRLICDPTLSFMAGGDWARLTGLTLADDTCDLVRCRVPASGPARVRASLLAPRGLVVLTLRRGAYACRLTLSLAPGMRAEVEAAGRTLTLLSGIHIIDV